MAVERSGQLGTQWGLRKESNPDSSLATRRESFSIDAATDPKAVADRKQPINSEISARKSSTAITETIPETAVESPPVESEMKSGYLNGNTGRGKIAPTGSKASANPDKKTSIEERNSKLIPGDTSNVAVSGVAALNNAGANGKVKPIPATKDTAKAVPASRTAKPVPISTAPSSASTKAAPKLTKSPAAPKTPTTPGKAPTSPSKSSKAPTSMAQTKPGDMKITKSMASSTSTSKPAARPAASSAVTGTSENKPPHASPSTGFHKPKPKSPTIPAKLPASMTAPTASSLSKVSTAAVSSRQSLAPSTKTVSRSPSHASLSQKQELRWISSKIDGDRPALGKPTASTLKKQPSRQSLPKQTAPADESFLTRMMRPTTSSASKTTEKIVTPPRAKPSTRPTTREGPGAHKLHQGLKGSPSTNKLPLATKETRKEGQSTVLTGKMEGPAVAAVGSTQTEPAPPAKAGTPVPNTTEGGLAAASSTENKSAEQTSAKEETTVEAGPTTATESTADADQKVEQEIIAKEAKPSVEAAKSVDTEPGAANLVIPEEPGNTASKFVELNANSEEPIVSDEPEVDACEDHTATKVVSEQSEEEQKAEDTVTAA